MYNSLGITISGFGQNGAIVFDAEDTSYLISPPNSLFFISAFPFANGGLIKGPETFTFYPPVQTFQFDTATFGGCALLVTAGAFAPDGTPVGNATIQPVEGGVTVALAFPPPGAQTVLITDAPNPICGTVGLEAFSIDNIAFVGARRPRASARRARSMPPARRPRPSRAATPRRSRRASRSIRMHPEGRQHLQERRHQVAGQGRLPGRWPPR